MSGIFEKVSSFITQPPGSQNGNTVVPQYRPSSATSVSNAVDKEQADTIPRLYHYKDDVLVFNETFGGNHFAEHLDRVHGYIDCIHDQLGSRMNSSINKDELKNLIWKYFIGENVTHFTTSHSGSEKMYEPKNSIESLHNALEIKDNAIDTFMEITFHYSDGRNTVTGNNEKTMMPFDGKRLWNEFKDVDTNNTNIDKNLSAGTIYRIRNYSGKNFLFGSSEKAGRIAGHIHDSENINTHYVLDCGSGSFQRGYVNKKKEDEAAISITSGIIDSSTTNDPVPIDNADKKDKLKFKIPFLYLPDGNKVYVHCEFLDNEGTEKLKLTFNFNKSNKEITVITVDKNSVPNLPEVTNYIASMTGVDGCLESLKKKVKTTVTGNNGYINPCNYIINQLGYANQSQEFCIMFMIAIKHLGDKTRLADPLMVNDSFKPEYGKCYTGTFDSFANRFAILGNMHTIMPNEGRYLIINNNHIITPEQKAEMKKAIAEKKKLEYQNQEAQFTELQSYKNNITKAKDLIDKLNEIIVIFNTDLKPVEPRRKRNLCDMMSPVTIQYWKVEMKNKSPIANIINYSYDKNEIESINNACKIVASMKNINIDNVFEGLTKTIESNKVNAEQANNDIKMLDSDQLKILLDLNSLYSNALIASIISTNGDIDFSKYTKKCGFHKVLSDLHITNNSINVCNKEKELSGGSGDGDDNCELYKIMIEDLNTIYSKESINKCLKFWDIRVESIGASINIAKSGEFISGNYKLTLPLDNHDLKTFLVEQQEIDNVYQKIQEYIYTGIDDYVGEDPDYLVKQIGPLYEEFEKRLKNNNDLFKTLENKQTEKNENTAIVKTKENQIAADELLSMQIVADEEAKKEKQNIFKSSNRSAFKTPKSHTIHNTLKKNLTKRKFPKLESETSFILTDSNGNPIVDKYDNLYSVQLEHKKAKILKPITGRKIKTDVNDDIYYQIRDDFGVPVNDSNGTPLVINMEGKVRSLSATSRVKRKSKNKNWGNRISAFKTLGKRGKRGGRKTKKKTFRKRITRKKRNNKIRRTIKK